jgi:hypothetical protein
MGSVPQTIFHRRVDVLAKQSSAACITTSRCKTVEVLPVDVDDPHKALTKTVKSKTPNRKMLKSRKPDPFQNFHGKCPR